MKYPLYNFTCSFTYENKILFVTCLNSMCEMKLSLCEINFHMRMFNFLGEIHVSCAKNSHVKFFNRVMSHVN